MRPVRLLNRNAWIFQSAVESGCNRSGGERRDQFAAATSNPLTNFMGEVWRDLRISSPMPAAL
jgi:hypothetical protein